MERIIKDVAKVGEDIIIVIIDIANGLEFIFINIFGLFNTLHFIIYYFRANALCI